MIYNRDYIATKIWPLFFLPPVGVTVLYHFICLLYCTVRVKATGSDVFPSLSIT